MNIKEVNLIGAGSLGGFTTQMLAKIHPTIQCPIKVWDFDKVEGHNVENQIYNRKDMGKKKVYALSKIIKKLGESGIIAVNRSVDEKTDLRGVVIVAVDSMKARKKITEACKFDWGVDYLIEARMGGHIGRIFAIDPRHPKSVERYSQFLYEDKDVENPVCATNETVPTLWIAASSIVWLVLNYKREPILRNNFIEIVVNMSNQPVVNSEFYALI